MSGYAHSVLAADGLLGDGVRLLTKPFGTAELAAAVRAALDAPNVAAADE